MHNTASINNYSTVFISHWIYSHYAQHNPNRTSPRTQKSWGGGRLTYQDRMTCKRMQAASVKKTVWKNSNFVPHLSLSSNEYIQILSLIPWNQWWHSHWLNLNTQGSTEGHMERMDTQVKQMYMPEHTNIQAWYRTGLCLGIWEYTAGQGPWSPHAAGSCAFQWDSPPAAQQHNLLQNPMQEASVDSLTMSVSRTRGMRKWILHHKCSKLISLSGEAWSRTACPGTWDCESTPGRSDSEL